MECVPLQKVWNSLRKQFYWSLSPLLVCKLLPSHCFWTFQPDQLDCKHRVEIKIENLQKLLNCGKKLSLHKKLSAIRNINLNITFFSKLYSSSQKLLVDADKWSLSYWNSFRSVVNVCKEGLKLFLRSKNLLLFFYFLFEDRLVLSLLWPLMIELKSK